jgi:hypothetical protein
MFMKYSVISKNNLPELISVVDQHIANGWKLAGGICAVQEKEYNTPYSYTLFMRAVILGAWAVIGKSRPARRSARYNT